MFIIRLIRKVFSLLRSNLTGHEIALGFCLGLLLGCVPLSSVFAVAALLLLVLIFRASITAFILAAAVVKLLSFVVDPILFKLGEIALEGPLAGLFGWMVNQPVLALLHLHRYVVAGGILFTILASIVCYPALYFLTNKYRLAILRWTEKSPGFAKFTQFPLIKFLTWLFMGKKKGDYQETLELKKSPIRKGAVILLVSFVVVFGLFSFFFGDALAKMGFEKGLSSALDKDVTTRDLGLSIIRGNLALEDFIVLEKDENENIVHAVEFNGDLSVMELLRRHLVFEKIEIKNMDFRVKRDEEGRLNLEKRKSRKDREREEKKMEEAGLLDGLELSDVLQQKEMARDVINKIRDFFFSPDEEGAGMEAKKEAYAEQGNYADLFAEFLLEKDQPLVVIDNFWIRGLKLRMEDQQEPGPSRAFSNLTLHATNLSSNPRLYKKDCLIKLGDNDLQDPTFYLEISMKWSSPQPDPEIKIQLRDMPSEAVMGFIKPGEDLVFSQGTVNLDSQTVLREGALDSVNQFALRGMTAAPAQRGSKVLGLDGELFCKGLNEFLKDSPLETVVKITGPYGGLKIDVDEKGLIESVKQGVMNSGDRILREQLDQQIAQAEAIVDEKMAEAEKRISKETDKLKEKVGDKLGEEVEKGLGDILKGSKKEKKGLLDQAGGLFGKKKKKKEEDKKK